MTNIRYQIFPQMQYYDAMAAGQVVPFAMLSGPISYSSSIINTDRHGFRLTKYKDKYIGIDDIASFESVNFIIGGSSVFGVGASSDDTTIASLLSEETGFPWFSLGIRGGVSLQEYIHLIRFVHKAKKVDNIVFFSGINDIYINLLTDHLNAFDNRFESDNTSQSCKKKIVNQLLAKLLFLDPFEIMELSPKEILRFRFGNRKASYARHVLSDSERLDVLFENYQRNFFLYSALQQKTGCKITFCLQPFAHWTEKVLSDEERQVFDYLDELQKDSKWISQKTKFTKDVYLKTSDFFKNLASHHALEFVDSHESFKQNDTLFVDTVHLNDRGNEIAKNLIVKYINTKQ